MRIEELTVRPPVTASPATTIQQAAALMARDAVGTLVITEGERVVGIGFSLRGRWLRSRS